MAQRWADRFAAMSNQADLDRSSNWTLDFPHAFVVVDDGWPRVHSILSPLEGELEAFYPLQNGIVDIRDPLTSIGCCLVSSSRLTPFPFRC